MNELHESGIGHTVITYLHNGRIRSQWVSANVLDPQQHTLKDVKRWLARNEPGTVLFVTNSLGWRHYQWWPAGLLEVEIARQAWPIGMRGLAQ
jgi:hypothetical protein